MKLNGFKRSYAIYILFITPQSSTSINYSECLIYLAPFLTKRQHANQQRNIERKALHVKSVLMCYVELVERVCYLLKLAVRFQGGISRG